MGKTGSKVEYEKGQDANQVEKPTFVYFKGQFILFQRIGSAKARKSLNRSI